MKQRLPDLALIAATFVFGGTFLSVHFALGQIGPFSLLFCRFILGSIVLAIIGRRSLGKVSRQEMTPGILVGVIVFIGIALQTYGLKFVDSSKSGFITALYVPFVPLFQVAVLKKRPSGAVWIGTMLSLIGLVFLSSKSGLTFTFGLGEWLTFASAIAFTLQIVLIGKFAPHANPGRLTFVQLSTVCLLSLIAVPFNQEVAPQWDPTLAAIIVLLGVVATGLSILAMNWGQRSVPATRATLIYAMEPVWAGILGAIAGERFTPLGLVGCGLIVCGMIAGELGPRKEPKAEDLENSGHEETALGLTAQPVCCEPARS